MSSNATQTHESIVRKPILTEKEANFKQRLFQKPALHDETRSKPISWENIKKHETDKQVENFMQEMATTLKRTTAGSFLLFRRYPDQGYAETSK